jgi:two-component system LytT family response regulator
VEIFDREFEVVVVDDDDEAVRIIRDELEQEEGVRLAGVVADAGCLEEILADPRPDVVFLDPTVGPGDSASVLARITEGAWSAVVLVTHARELAVEAFDRGVVDFLMKPPSRARVREALGRARREAVLQSPGSLDSGAAALLEHMSSAAGTDAAATRELSFPGRLMIKEQGRVFFVQMEEIRYVRSDGNYLRIHTGDSEHLARGTMNEVEARLDPGRFVRIHRSTIVNVEWVEEFRSDAKGGYSVVLKDGSELVLSRSYRDQVLRRAL